LADTGSTGCWNAKSNSRSLGLPRLEILRTLVLRVAAHLVVSPFYRREGPVNLKRRQRAGYKAFVPRGIGCQLMPVPTWLSDAWWPGLSPDRVRSELSISNALASPGTDVSEPNATRPLIPAGQRQSGSGEVGRAFANHGFPSMFCGGK